ncbi:MAG: hypothetical protein QOF48_3273 [Verrucomicrobiota bacterium]|jgi:diguanylate cyclase (GGDEF)-like protein
MDDIRYSELVFLRQLATGSRHFEFFCTSSPEQIKAIDLPQTHYIEMAIALLEDLYIRFDDQEMQTLVSRLRGEMSPGQKFPQRFREYQWENPRQALRDVFIGSPVHRLVITYRGLRRIEELREALQRDRILEFFEVLLDLRYFCPDLMRAFQRSNDTPISVLYADMDKFGEINKEFGQAAGDVVMKAYLEAVRDGLGEFGNGYRSLGDETVSLIVGQQHKRTIELAEGIRTRVQNMQCNHKRKKLPKVSVSIGIATTPPDARTADLIDVAEERKRQAKKSGRNCVISN